MTEGATQLRERKHRAAVNRKRTPGRFNPDAPDHLVDLAFESALKAVHGWFEYLSIEQIRQPGPQEKEAQFARQIAIHLMASELDIPQRQIARLQKRQRTHIHFALKAIEKRMETKAFKEAYERLAVRAVAEYEAVIGGGITQ